MRVSWNQSRILPENLPAHLLRVESTIPPAQRQKLEDTMGLGTTGVFDTHPSKGDRIRRARRAAEPGVFHLDAPSTLLFSNFEVPAKQVTLLHYADDLGIPIIAAKLVPEHSANKAPDEPAAAAESPGQPQVAQPNLKVRLRPRA
jgi:hypothetical protein